jgi:hydrophobic/amphiphilic exporter-1 (mainly G- bacteria), HAE1 family
MTFGGLALGVGMIVDASIVVLENSFRHMEKLGKDRVTAAIDGSEEVWSAILAAILTHIAVFVPLLFLSGVANIMFKQLAVVVMFSLMMSLFVAVTIVPVLCSKLLKLPPSLDQRRGLSGRLYTMSERGLGRLDDFYRQLPPHRAAAPADGAAVGACCCSGRDCAAADAQVRAAAPGRRGRGPVDIRAPVGSRIERTDAVVRVSSKALIRTSRFPRR